MCFSSARLDHLRRRSLVQRAGPGTCQTSSMVSPEPTYQNVEEIRELRGRETECLTDAGRTNADGLRATRRTGTRAARVRAGALHAFIVTHTNSGFYFSGPMP